MATEQILVLVFGATTGATLHEFIVGKGFRMLWKKDIPWRMDGTVYRWPMEWLYELLAEVKATATPGTIIAPAMWGADLVHMNGGAIDGNVVHYRSIPTGFANELMAATDIPRCEWSRLMGYVHPEFYQAVFASSFWRNYAMGDQFHVKAIPLADWMTYKLSDRKGHDHVMLHNQGLGVPTSKLVNCWFGKGGLTEFAPIWRRFTSRELLRLPNDVSVMPCSHDSPYARLILASTGLEWGLWTGSWYGLCYTGYATPNEKTFEAGLVSEVMPGGGMATVSNIAMHGPLWKALRDTDGPRAYEQAAQLALAVLPIVYQEDPFSHKMLQLAPNEFATSALLEAEGRLDVALAIMANTIAVHIKAGLVRAASALGIECPEKIAVVGGFADNAAIHEALRHHGITLVVPPFAGMATQAGLAVNGLCRTGEARDTKEALKMLPNVDLG